MTTPPSPQPGGTTSSERETSRRARDRGIVESTVGSRLFRLLVLIGFLVLSSGTASAHGGSEHGGPTVAFQVVLWVPVLIGFLGGVGALGSRASTLKDSHGHRVDVALALLLLVLGGTFVISASTTVPLLGIGSACIGVLVTHRIVFRTAVSSRAPGHHGRLTLGGVCAHRVLEGVAIGTMYAVSSAIGAVGMVVVAGHTALETAAVGRSFSPRRVRAFAAVCLVQVGYVVGAVGGIGGSLSVPTEVRVATTGLLAGVFLTVGVAELRHTSTVLAHGGVPE